MYNVILTDEVAEFIADLNERAKKDKRAHGLLKKIVYCVERLKRDGTRVGAPITKYIGDKIWELRPDDHRILFFGHDGNNFVLLHVFRKETKKTPPAEIETAKRRMKNFKK